MPSDEAMEEMSEQIHKNYCEYVLARTGKPYWTGGDYSKLDEETKEADRIQARWFMGLIDRAREDAWNKSADHWAKQQDAVIDLAITQEREACAEVAESYVEKFPNAIVRRPGWQQEIANAIRQRGGSGDE